MPTPMPKGDCPSPGDQGLKVWFGRFKAFISREFDLSARGVMAAIGLILYFGVEDLSGRYGGKKNVNGYLLISFSFLSLLLSPCYR